MSLATPECWELLRSADHGVLATRHVARGVDAVPVVFVIDHDKRIVIPIDTVKAKTTTRLQRLANIATDARVMVLAEHYEEDWTQLWWVRARGRAGEVALTDGWMRLLAEKYPAYRAEGAIVSAIVVDVEEVSGWKATAPSTSA
jgi:PPOX class probable F420-dependent enzyme